MRILSCVIVVLCVAAPTAAQSTTKRASLADMKAWAGSSMDDWVSLGQYLTAMNAVASSGNVAGMLPACRAFKEQVAKIRLDLPSPDDRLDEEIMNVANDFEASANHCIRGVRTINPPDIKAATEHMYAGTAALKRATELIASYQ